MGFFIIFLIIAAILIIYLLISNGNLPESRINIIVGCLVVSLIGSLFFGIMLGVGEPEDDFIYWLGDREDCERDILIFNEQTDYYKFKIITDIKENNEELETALKYHDWWLFDGFYADHYIYYEPLEIPKLNLNSREEKMN